MNVKKVILEKGYTISQVAEMIGVKRTSLSVSLSNNPTTATLKKVADAIGCQVGDFFKDEVSESNSLVCKCPNCGGIVKINVEFQHFPADVSNHDSHEL